MSQKVIPRKIDDEYETPQNVFDKLCGKYGFYPTVDVCATESNKKCEYYISKGSDDDPIVCRWGVDALSNGTLWGNKNWMNPPHSQTEQFVKKACREFLEYDHETIAIIAANSMCAAYSEFYIEPHAEDYKIYERPRFKKDGESKDSPLNAYFVVIWRKQKIE